MGKLTVALSERTKWTIEPPLSDELGETLFAQFENQPTGAFVSMGSFLRAAAPRAHEDPELQKAVNEIATEEESTMVVLEWDRPEEVVEMDAEVMAKMDEILRR